MLSVLKSNKASALNKPSRFKTAAKYKESGSLEFNFPKATQEQLNAIRKRKVKEEWLVLIKTISVFILIVIGLVFFVIS